MRPAACSTEPLAILPALAASQSVADFTASARSIRRAILSASSPMRGWVENVRCHSPDATLRSTSEAPLAAWTTNRSATMVTGATTITAIRSTETAAATLGRFSFDSSQP